MKYTVLPYDDSLTHGPLRYLIDKDSDISELPTDCSVGSKVIVAESGNTYLLNNQHEWKLQPISSSSESGEGSGASGGSADPGYVVSTEKIYYAEEQTVILDENGHASLDIGENTFSDLHPENGKTGYITINGVEYAGEMQYYGGWYIGSFNDVLDIDGVTAYIETVGEANYSQPSLYISSDETSLAGKSITVSVYAIGESITISEDFTKVVEKLTGIYTYYFDLNTGSRDITIPAGSLGGVNCTISTELTYNYDFSILENVNLTNLSTDLQLVAFDGGLFSMTFFNKSSSAITIPANTVVGRVLCVRHGHPVVEETN